MSLSLAPDAIAQTRITISIPAFAKAVYLISFFTIQQMDKQLLYYQCTILFRPGKKDSLSRKG